MRFALADLENLQRLAYPLLYTLAGVDIPKIVGDKAEVLEACGDLLGDVSSLFMLAAEAADDGIATADEINGLVAKAQTLDDAIDAIREALEGGSAEPVVTA